MKSKKDIKKEGIGDLNGADTFQGGPFGIGNKKQLVKPNNFIQYLTKEDEEEQLKIHEISEDSMYMYRDIMGSPDQSALEAPKDFTPDDPNEDLENEWLGPTIDGSPLDGIELSNPAFQYNMFDNPDHSQLSSKGGARVSSNSLNSTMWSSGQSSLAKPEDFIQDIEDMKNGDINANNPVGGAGVLLHPIKHVPDDGEPKSVRFKENKNMKKNLIKEMINLLVEETINEIEATEMKFVPGIAAAGNLIPQNILQQLNSLGLQITNSKTLPLNFNKGYEEIQKTLNQYKVAPDIVNNILSQLKNMYQENLSMAQKALVSQKQKSQIVAPKPIESIKTPLTNEEIGHLNNLINIANNPNVSGQQKENYDKQISEMFHNIGEQDLRKHIASMSFNAALDPKIKNRMNFLIQRYKEVFGKDYVANSKQN